MPPPITPERMAALPPEFRELLPAVIDHYEAILTDLQSQLAEARKTPLNSSKPPSTEHPHAKPIPPKSPSKRKRGGQPGHPKHERELIPTATCDTVVTRRPSHGRRCQHPLVGTDLEPLRHPVGELPDIRPHVTEYQRHRLVCGCCGGPTCAALPDGVPESQAGPNLVAFTAVLMSGFRQSKRRVALFLEMVLNQPCSPGWVVKLQNQATQALRPAYREWVDAVPKEKVLGGDESPPKQGSWKAWRWTLVASRFTLLAIRPTRKAEVLSELLGPKFEGVIICDRAKRYWQCGQLPWCWAHRKRDFQSWVESPDGAVKRLGHDLMRETRKWFDLWRKCRDETLSRSALKAPMEPVQRTVEGLLRRGRFSGKPGVAGSCAEWWEHRSWRWTFVTTPGVEPTNNASERALRPAVIWRKLSFGTPSASGSRFVETLLSVVETCRQRKRNVLSFVRASVRANFAKRTPPQLLAGL
jgi:transposase